MKPARNKPSTGLKKLEAIPLLRVSFLRATFFWVSWLSAGDGTLKADAPVAMLEFNQPTNNAVFSRMDEVPILLRAFAPDDVFPTAELFSDGAKIADLSYCCAFCPCAAPQ